MYAHSFTQNEFKAGNFTHRTFNAEYCCMCCILSPLVNGAQVVLKLYSERLPVVCSNVSWILSSASFWVHIIWRRYSHTPLSPEVKTRSVRLQRKHASTKCWFFFPRRDPLVSKTDSGRQTSSLPEGCQRWWTSKTLSLFCRQTGNSQISTWCREHTAGPLQ